MNAQDSPPIRSERDAPPGGGLSRPVGEAPQRRVGRQPVIDSPAKRGRRSALSFKWLFLLPVFALLQAAPAEESPQQVRSDSPESHPRRAFGFGTIDWVREREAVQLLVALAKGEELGPGRGWFKDSESCYGFEWLADRFDTDGDGRITPDEFEGPAAFFARLDRNKDGAIQADDFDWSDTSPYLRQVAASKSLFQRIDRNGDGRISAEEWNTIFMRMQSGKDHLDPDDLQALLFPPPRHGNRPGPSTTVLLKGLLKAEIGSIFEGPAVGATAPDFELKTQHGDQTVRLSDYRGEKPVVLIFGSFT